MKRIALLLTASLSAASSFAQLPTTGFYRVQNVVTERYLTMIDNHGNVDVASQTFDAGALQTIKNFSNVVGNPASVIYITPKGDGYDFQCQGASTSQIIGYDLRILDNEDGTFQAYASRSGLTKYINDSYGNSEIGKVDANDTRTRDWYIKPISQADGLYFGVAPSLAVNGKYYQSFYASFAYSFASSGMKAYYVREVDEEMGVAIWEEITGAVPAATPVVLEASSTDAANNKFNLLASAPTSLASNVLKGVYFNNGTSGHVNRVAYDPRTMRILGTTSDGKLAFVKSSISYIPANTAYIVVSSSAPAEIPVVTREEYSELLKAPVTVTVSPSDREYGDANPPFFFTVSGGSLKGRPVMECAATLTSTAGDYPITIAKGTIKNENVTLVPGVLTVTKAPMKVEVASAYRYTGDENPIFIIVYDPEGWKNGENESVLTKKAVAETDATIDSPAGIYEIRVFGAESPNYEFEYENGTLTITENPSGIAGVKLTKPVDVYSVYGYKVRSQVRSLDELPKGLYIIDGKKVMVK